MSGHDPEAKRSKMGAQKETKKGLKRVRATRKEKQVGLRGRAEAR